MDKNNSPVTHPQLEKALQTLRKDLKSDINSVDKKLSKQIKKLEAKIGGVEQKLEAKIGGVEQKLDQKINFSVAILREEIKISANNVIFELDTKSRNYRDEILNTMDEFLQEIRASRQEREIVSHRLTNHEDRLEKIEETLSLPTPS